MQNVIAVLLSKSRSFVKILTPMTERETVFLIFQCVALFDHRQELGSNCAVPPICYFDG